MAKIRNKNDLLQYHSVQRMISALRAKRGGVPSKSTESAFLNYMFKYVVFFSKEKGSKRLTPDQIMAERKKHWQSQDDDVRRLHEETVNRFLTAIRQEKWRGKPASSGKVAYALTAVRAFYKANYRDLKGIPTTTIVTETQYKVPTPEEFADVCAIANKRLITYMLCNKDCGMSPIDLLNLTGLEESTRFGTIKHQLKVGQVPIHVHIAREKTKTRLGFYDTFLGEDAVEALQAWLKGRYRKFFNVGLRMLEINFIKLGDKMGWKNFTPKSCRKYFSSQLTFGNVNNAIIEYWMGHSLRRVKGAYIVERLRDHPEQLAKIYVEHYELLRVPM